MAKDVYSAGLMSQSFWFHEFKKAVKLMKDGLSFDEIKKKCVEENLFGAAKEYRALRMAGYIVNRLKVMDDTMVDLFLTSDLATQKLINLITILKQDLLFFEFIYEVYREKVILGAETLDDMDVKSFFTKKEGQSDTVAKWTDKTKSKVGTAYKTFMVESNLLSVIEKEKRITPPVLDIALERYLIATGEDTMVRALTGVN